MFQIDTNRASHITYDSDRATKQCNGNICTSHMLTMTIFIIASKYKFNNALQIIFSTGSYLEGNQWNQYEHWTVIDKER